MTFASVVGHSRVVTLLRHAVSRGSVPQSLLFAGPDGVGKHAMAIALAAAVNCPNRKDGDACGTSPTCRRIDQGHHSDVVVVDKGDEASIKIRHLRERVLDTVNYRPFEASRRVYLIDPADEMTPEAQDALLKTLEEPPSASIIILVTAYPDTLSSTVRSRCRRLRFGVLREADVAAVLVAREGMDGKTARRLAATSGGSVARALAEQSGDFDADREAAMALLMAARHQAVGARLEASAAFAKHGSGRRDREAMAERVAIMLSLLRALAVLGAGATGDLANQDLTATLRELLPAFDLGRAREAFDHAERAVQLLDRNAGPKIVADWLAVTM